MEGLSFLKPLYWVGFVLHVFQKTSTRGAATSRADIDLIRERLRVAEQIAKELSQ